LHGLVQSVSTIAAGDAYIPSIARTNEKGDREIAPSGLRLGALLDRLVAPTRAQSDAEDAVQKMTLGAFALPSFACANIFGAMHYESVEYVVRASLGRDELTLLIYFPEVPDSNPTVVKFSGSRDGAGAAARRRIDDWIKRQQ
jgi:hypothetical protein